ncbi:MAG: hypothetical protein VX385_05245, partial [Acidobacteriota bacterium]|nr:hypothetical protein [Acidobacteriota bacterium]
GRPLEDGTSRRDTPKVRLLDGWRREVAGEDVMRLLAGRIALRVKIRSNSVDLAVEDEKNS